MRTRPRREVPHAGLLAAVAGAVTVVLVPEYSYARTVDGFAAPVDARSLALLERAPEVEGVYPVRAAYPATTPALSRDALERANVSLPGFDGRGVTVALLD